MSKVDAQIRMEEKYSRKEIRKLVRKEITTSKEIVDKIQQAVTMSMEWVADPDHHDSKRYYLDELTPEICENICIDILTQVCVDVRIRAITELVGMPAANLPKENYLGNLMVVAGVCRWMHEVELINVYQAYCSPVYQNGSSVIGVGPVYQLSERMSIYLQQTMHLPPFIAPPLEVTKNSDSAYYIEDKPVLLKGYNQHSKPIALDVINIANSQTFSLDIDFLNTVRDEFTPSKKKQDKATKEAQYKQWEKFQKDSMHVYIELYKQGNKFWLGHHYDFRGRLYCRGYHVTSQGNSFKKAILNFHEERTIPISQEERDCF